MCSAFRFEDGSTDEWVLMFCNFTPFLGLPAVSPLVFLLTNKEPEARRGPAKKGRTNKEDCRLLNLSPLSLKLLVTRVRVLVHNTHMSECVERLLQPLRPSAVTESKI